MFGSIVPKMLCAPKKFPEGMFRRASWSLVLGIKARLGEWEDQLHNISSGVGKIIIFPVSKIEKHCAVALCINGTHN